jgi:hypothetical protein
VGQGWLGDCFPFAFYGLLGLFDTLWWDFSGLDEFIRIFLFLIIHELILQAFRKYVGLGLLWDRVIGGWLAEIGLGWFSE